MAQKGGAERRVPLKMISRRFLALFLVCSAYVSGLERPETIACELGTVTAAVFHVVKPRPAIQVDSRW